MRTERGFTLLEMTMATVCLAIIGMGVAGVSASSSQAMTTNAAVLECQSEANRCVEKLERHLRSASLGSFATLPAGFETLQPLADGVEVEDLSWQSFAYDPGQLDALPTVGGNLFSVGVAASASDPENGVDDDHDGTVDDVDIVMVRPDAGAEVIARDVTDCSFQLDGRTLTVSVLVRMRMPDGNSTFARATRAVEIRND